MLLVLMYHAKIGNVLTNTPNCSVNYTYQLGTLYHASNRLQDSLIQHMARTPFLILGYLLSQLRVDACYSFDLSFRPYLGFQFYVSILTLINMKMLLFQFIYKIMCEVLFKPDVNRQLVLWDI